MNLLHPEQLFKALLSEAFYHRKAIVAVFVAVNLVMLSLGLLWPQAFSASTSILLEDKRVIQPLMQGAAVATDVADRGRLAREVIFGREIMNQIL